MKQTNRADAERQFNEGLNAAELYLEAVGFTKPEPVPDVRPRMRFVHNLGVYQLTATNGVRVMGNDIESTYLRWIRTELERNANEDYNDMPAYERLVSKRCMIRTLVATGAGLLIIALAAFVCMGFR